MLKLKSYYLKIKKSLKLNGGNAFNKKYQTDDLFQTKRLNIVDTEWT